METETEVLVVGSGPGGSVTAAVLAEAGFDVLICEEGQWHDYGTFPQYSNQQMAAQYRCAGLTATFGRPPIAYAEAQCAGGGSEINSGLYHRPPPELLMNWRGTNEIQDLGETELEEHSVAIEAALSIGTHMPSSSPASRRLAEGAEALGWAAQKVPQWHIASSNASEGRQTMTRTYLPRAFSAGAALITGCRVQRLVRTAQQTTEAHCRITTEGGSIKHLIRARWVVLCAGAVQTPAILLRSGLGGPLGQTLQVHPTVKVAAVFPEDVHAAEVPVHQIKEFAPDLSIGGSASLPSQIALVLSDTWQESGSEMSQHRNVGVFYAAIRPQGSGRVITLPLLRDPLVTYHLTRSDLMLLGKGLEHLTRLALAAGANRVWASMRGAPCATSPDQANLLARNISRSNISLMSVHLFSSVPMGEHSCCPADSFGRLRTDSSIAINDASLLPTAPGVNPQGTIMAIAHRNAVRWAQEWSPHRAS